MPLLTSLKQMIPGRLSSAIKSGLRTRYPYHCPICDLYTDAFLPFGDPPRPQAACYRCQALERDRLLCLFMRANPGVFRDRLLHFAPEPSVTQLFRAQGLHPTTTDLASTAARVHSDITHLPFADETFATIYCSHVLEHIVDDGRAMAECARVLQVGGHAVFQVPVRGEHTYEDWSVTTPDGRRQHFGQHDHVRFYGRDIASRLRAAGFTVTGITPDALTCGLPHIVVDPSYTSPLWVCRRQ